MVLCLKQQKKDFLPELMQKMYDERVKFKQLMLEAKKDYERTKDPKLKKTISKFNNIQMAKRFLLIVHMVLLVMSGLGIIIFWLLKQLLPVVNFLLDILNILLMGILIKYLKPMEKITLLHQIRIRCIFVLTNLSIKYSKENKIKKNR